MGYIVFDDAGRVVETDHPLNILSGRSVGPLGTPGQALVVAPDGQNLIWSTGGGGGGGTVTGSGATNQIAFWNSSSNITGAITLTWDGTTLDVQGDILIEGQLDVQSLALFEDTVTISASGLNIGSSTGAGSGDIRMSGALNVGTATSSSPGSINTVTTTTIALQIQTSTVDAQVLLDDYNNSATGNRLIFRSARGTIGSPAATQLNDQIMGIRIDGYHTAGTPGFGTHGAALRYLADEAWTDTAQGTRWEFYTTATGGATALTQALVITSAQGITVANVISSSNGLHSAALADAATNTAPVAFQAYHNSSAGGTIAAGLGSTYAWIANDTTTSQVTQAQLIGSWVSATHASYTSQLKALVMDSAGTREGWRIESDGAAPRIGFLGASAIVRPSSTTDLRAALINLGLYTTGGASPLDLNGGALTTAAITAVGNVGVTGNINLDGTTVRTMGMIRNTIASTGGNQLTISSGGVTSGGTDLTAGELILQSGLSTGTGSSIVRVRAPYRAASTASADNSNTDKAAWNASRFVTNNSATAVLSLAIATSTVIGGQLFYTATCRNATDFQSQSGVISWNAQNKAGTVTANVSAATAVPTLAASTGTFTVAWTISAATPAVLSVTLNSSLASISTGFPRLDYVFFNNTGQGVTIQ